MPALTNKRHELFAQNIVAGMTQVDAYAAAGFTGSPGALMANASRLIRTDKVASRIAELNEPVIAALQVSENEAVASAAWIVARAVEIVQIGMATIPVRDRKGDVIEDEDGKPAFYDSTDLKAANSALALLAKRHGDFSEKHDVRAEVGVVLVRQTRGLRGG